MGAIPADFQVVEEAAVDEVDSYPEQAQRKITRGNDKGALVFTVEQLLTCPVCVYLSGSAPGFQPTTVLNDAGFKNI
ncbi:hypothetical protein FKG94_16170 [Exilibacterium tricleocarpae]|uniref:Uncharacterized protein n=1 Tax=Exilibacterium tricleocarpae TaxID=2591008 RepID=A0A545TBG5_9GAMM|nr:hypothetical protein [Exilibacterium tricleocarpae]TQV74546.1 hypothetical protein FKG94_16170 [Exilibacterium tricleocarpae]